MEAPANTIWETLCCLEEDFVLIRHGMDASLPTTVYFYRDGKLCREKKVLSSIRIAPIRYILQILANLLIVAKIKTPEKIFIGVDPLNAFSGVILYKLRFVKKYIFFSVDYTDKRFKNRFINSVYLYLDKLSALHASQVWNVSTRIWGLRGKMGVDKRKNLVVPNLPSNEYKNYVHNSKKQTQLITLGKINEQLDFMNLFRSLKTLKKEGICTSLVVVGDGSMLDEYKQYVIQEGLEDTITFTGYLEHKDALKMISESGIGLALYNGKWSFNYYGDSMKCREYCAFGLPIITTDTHSTVEDIRKYKAGIIVELNSRSYTKAIKKMLNNYEKYVRGTQKMHNAYAGIHIQLLKSIEKL